MVTALPPSSFLYWAGPGLGYDGVVLVRTDDGYYGSGVLLYDGGAVLTAAHLVARNGLPGAVVDQAEVVFQTTDGEYSYISQEISVPTSYDPENLNGDLALIWLPSTAPVSAERYELYRSHDEIGRVMTLVGYGVPGDGFYGMYENWSGPPLRLRAWNRADADAGTVKEGLGYVMDWDPKEDSQLVADFDDGTMVHDAMGSLLGVWDLGLGYYEGMISSGDSGGPAFIEGKVAGIATAHASLGFWNIWPDVDIFKNSSFGEMGFWQRVSSYQEWIDRSLRSHYPNAPSRPEDVQKRVTEGDAGTTYAYFLLQFNGVRSDPNAWVSVDYETRDGTATAGLDYVPASGTLILYPGEDYAVIPVEIIGDTVPEPDETFFLDVFNPVGGSFGEGVTKLTAMRTIVDDDVSFWA